MKYMFSVYYFSCYKWDNSTDDWIYSCDATFSSTEDNITCNCYTSSVLIGRMDNVNVKLEETLMIEFELTFQVSHIIFITLMVTFGLFSILMSIFSVFTKGARKPVYYLSDIPSHYCYGYLVIVKTGNRRYAGTTSNVVIKLYGSQSNSDEHVLNYPDPDMNMLQKNNEDWFFLATERYLGEINKLEMWIDGIGQKPTWYCTEIEILDLQKKKYFIFDVNALFSDKEGHLSFTSTPMSKEEKTEVTVKTVFHVKFLMRILGQRKGPHMWNIFTGDDSQLSKVKRLTIMCSICLTIYTANILFYGLPRLQYSDSLSPYLEYWFHWEMVLASFVSVVFASIIHVAIVWIFRLTEEERMDNDKKWNLWNTICWSILIFTISSTMLLLLIFGFWVPHVNGLLWLTSSLIALLVYVFIVEYVIRIFVSIQFKEKSREEQIIGQIGTVLEYAEAQRSVLYRKFGPFLLRPYFEELYKIANEEQIKEKKLKAAMKEKLLEILEDLIMILIYVVLLYVIILYGRDEMEYRSNKEATELIAGIHSRSIGLDEVVTVSELETFLTETVVYSIQSPHWYGKFISKNPGLTIDHSNKYIGIARLRQHRSENTSCRDPDQMKFLNISCISDFRSGPVYDDFSEQWGNNDQSDPLNKMDSSWKYSTSRSAGTWSYRGILNKYPGSGYITPLGRTQRNSIIVLRYLRLTKWIDRHSRALFMEFLLYNANSNLFNFVRILFEFSVTGYMVQGYDINTASLLLIKENTGILIWLLFVAFVITVFNLTMKVISRIIDKKKIYFKGIMHCVDIVIICLSVTYLILYVNRSKMVGTFLKKLQEAKNNEFVNFFHLFYTDWVFTILSALLLFIATFRLWKLLRFLLIIKIVEKTIVLCYKPLLVVAMWQVVILLSYGLAGLLLFENDLSSFKELETSISSLLICSLGFDRDLDVNALKSSFQYFYYISFMIISLLIITLYIAIISVSYNDAQIIFSNVEEYNVIHFLKAKVKFYFKLFRVRIRNYRLRGGQNFQETKLVYPKADQHRFAQCLTSPKSKMAGMMFVTLCTLRNLHRGKSQDLNIKDRELMKNTIVSLLRDDSNDHNIFYISNLQGFKKSLVDDDVFVKMEKVVKYLVTEEKMNKTDKQKEFYRNMCQYQKKKMERINESLSLLSRLIKQIDFAN